MSTLKNSYWVVEARVTRLKELCDGTRTAAAVAAQLTEDFKVPITRNAIVGQVAKFGLKLTDSRGGGSKKGVRKPRSKPVVKKAAEEVEGTEAEFVPKPRPRSQPGPERTKAELYKMLQDAVRNTK